MDDANKAVSRAESIRRFRVLDTDFTEQAGYLTPSLKLRRNVVTKDFAERDRGALRLTGGTGAGTPLGRRGRRSTSSVNRWPANRATVATPPGTAQPARISCSRRATRSQRHSWSTQASPFSPMARAPTGSVSRYTSRPATSAGAAARDHVAGLAVADGVGGAAGVAADHRQPGRGGLQVDDAEALHVQAAPRGYGRASRTRPRAS